MRRLLTTGWFLCVTTALAAQGAPPSVTFEPYTFRAANGTTVEAELGAFQVPEHRGKPTSRRITLRFVRFKSTAASPGAPIVYLAGGPGGSGIGTATGPRFPIFMALREVADVIALDQRGVGRSNDLTLCPSKASSLGRPLTREAMTAWFRTELARCFDEWTAKGMDIDGYTTRENAADIDDLRRALGVPQVNLWGISYGSHLGLAVLKYYPTAVQRVVLAGIEGLDQTVKLPSETDSLFARVQKLIDGDPEARAAYPDLPGLMRRVHTALDRSPKMVTITPAGGASPVTLTLSAFPIQLLVGGMIADPAGIAQVPALYRALDRGEFDRVAQLTYRTIAGGLSGFRGMPEAMDLASGMSAARARQVTEEAARGILGDALNFPMPHVAGLRPSLDLGDAFRAPFRSNVPSLFISGTLDGRTNVREAREEIRGFSRGTHLIVENGGHNIYEADKRVADAVVRFFKGESVPTTLRLEPPVFVK